jgi:hypothetical protein
VAGAADMAVDAVVEAADAVVMAAVDVAPIAEIEAIAATAGKQVVSR